MGSGETRTGSGTTPSETSSPSEFEYVTCASCSGRGHLGRKQQPRGGKEPIYCTVCNGTGLRKVPRERVAAGVADTLYRRPAPRDGFHDREWSQGPPPSWLKDQREYEQATGWYGSPSSR